MKYLDSDTIAQCHQALRNGRSLDDIAGMLHFNAADLARLLGLSQSQQPANGPTGSDFDPWVVNRLDGVL